MNDKKAEELVKAVERIAKTGEQYLIEIVSFSTFVQKVIGSRDETLQAAEQENAALREELNKRRSESTSAAEATEANTQP